jgi:hypothetical protein
MVIDSRIILPVAYGEFTIRDLLKELDKKDKVKIYENDDKGLLYLTFESDKKSSTGQQSFEITEQSYTFSKSANQAGPLNDTSMWESNLPYTFPTDSFIFDVGDRILDSIILDTISIKYDVISSIKHNGWIAIDYPTLKPSGSTQNITDTIHLTGTNGYTGSKTTELYYHTLGIRERNLIPVQPTIYFKNSGKGVDNSDSIHLDISITNFDYHAIFGYLGQDTLLADDSIKISIDLLSSMKDFSFEDPRLFLSVDNSFGFPVKVQMDNISTYSEETGERVDLYMPYGNDFPIKYPNFNQFGEFVTTDTAFNNENVANFDEAANSNPNFLYYSVQSIYNADGVVNRNQFLIDTSAFDFYSTVELPFYGWANNSQINDTFDFNFEKDFMSEYDDHSILERFTLLISTVNGIPVDVETQLYLTDSSYNVIDSLFLPADQADNNYRLLTKAAKIDKNYKVTEKSENEISVTKTGEEIDNWKDVKLIVAAIYMATFNVENEKNIKIFDNQTFDINVGADIDYKASKKQIEDLVE